MFRTRYFTLVLSSFVSLIALFRFHKLVRLARQALATGLILMLVSNHALATPGVVFAAAEFGQEMRLRWHAKGWAELFGVTPAGQANSPKGWDGKGAPPRPRPAPEQQEKKADRERKVSRVKIFPGDHTIEVGQQAVLTAIAYDKDGAPVGGLDYKWEGLDEDRNASVTISQKATFSSAKPGRFKITVDVEGKKDHVRVTVTGEARNQELRGTPLPPVSSSDKPRPKQTSRLAPISGRDSDVARAGAVGARSFGGQVQPARASASPLSLAAVLQGDPYDYTWNTNNYTTSDDPGTERGDVPGHSMDGGAGSGNFQFTAPILSLDGRGIDLNLPFNYNSRTWHKAGSEMYFDID
jgi:hypothetical protein